MKYAFIKENAEYPVSEWAKFFGVSRSGYYNWKQNYEDRERQKVAYKAKIKRIFEESDGTYGADRICGLLRKQGETASFEKVRDHMREMGLVSVHCRNRRQRSLTDSRKARGEGYPNLVRGMKITSPYQAVCSDITYLKSGEGWLYHCIVKDIASGELLGDSYGERMTKELVIQAFLNAQARHNLPPGTIFHSDRGSQYTSNTFKRILIKYGIKQSFSRVGCPGDNAWAESFFATMKKECIHFRHFATRDELRATVFAWVNGFYNTRRVQARLGYMSPREYASHCAHSQNQPA